MVKRPAASTSTARISPLPALVVNLARRKDRWEEIACRLGKLRDILNFERVDSVDGTIDTISPNVVTTSWSTARNWRYVTKVFEGGTECGYTAKELALTPGERGCAASHVRVWQHCAGNSGPLVILEDDAKPLKGFSARLREALQDLSSQETDILYLAYTQAAPWRRTVSASVREAEYLWTTVAYVLWPSGARKLLAALPIDQPVDNFMASLMAQKILRGYAVVPQVVEQAKPWNVDNDVVHSDDTAWVQNC